VHKTDTATVVVGCSYAPIRVDANPLRFSLNAPVVVKKYEDFRFYYRQKDSKLSISYWQAKTEGSTFPISIIFSPYFATMSFNNAF
jgi:hypothetical protein